MQHIESWLSGIDGLDLYYQSWFPDQHVKAIIGIVHGLGSHSGWFMRVVAPLVEQGYGVYALDLRGHGQSPGQRGFISHWEDFRGDLHQFWQLMMTQNPNLPYFALGHSLGAVIILDYALHYPEALSGIITLAPAIGSVGVSPLKLAIGQLLSWIWPQFTLNTGLAKDGGSHDPTLISAYDNDPLRHSQGTARLAAEFLKTKQWIQSHLPDLTTPILILHGSRDPVALNESGRTAFEKLPCLDKSYREYLGAYHDLHNDTCALAVSQDILFWLEQHIQPEKSVYQRRSHFRSCQAIP
ncbi:MAG: lysophospholipase [Cyanobacteria bacterium P01_A01_bin.123]